VRRPGFYTSPAKCFVNGGTDSKRSPAFTGFLASPLTELVIVLNGTDVNDRISTIFGHSDLVSLYRAASGMSTTMGNWFRREQSPRSPGR